MTKVWRITGPPENFITGLTRSVWAVNESHENKWRNQIAPGDRVYFHSTRESQYSSKIRSSIVGFATVGARRFRKDELWWIQEIQENQNKWPFVFDLQQAYLFGDSAQHLDLKTPIQDKPPEALRTEVEALSRGGIELSKLHEQARELNLHIPQFPVNGSLSGFNAAYEEIILALSSGELTPTQNGGEDLDPDALEEMVIEQVLTDRLEGKTPEWLLAEARRYVAPAVGHGVSTSPRRYRIESARQKKIVAMLENHTCQVCGFRCEFLTARGKKAFVIDVDHIIEKGEGGTEELKNLWVLCPNCHRKKTRGVIKIDPTNRTVNESGNPVNLRDHHLGW